MRNGEIMKKVYFPGKLCPFDRWAHAFWLVPGDPDYEAAFSEWLMKKVNGWEYGLESAQDITNAIPKRYREYFGISMILKRSMDYDNQVWIWMFLNSLTLQRDGVSMSDFRMEFNARHFYGDPFRMLYEALGKFFGEEVDKAETVAVEEPF